MDRAKLEKAIKLARLIDANSNVNEALAAAKALAKLVLSMEPPPAPKNTISSDEAKKRREEILRQEKERQREKARKTAERIILACQVCGKASFFSPCSECDPITKTVQCDRCGGDKIGGVPCQACFGRGFLLAKGANMNDVKERSEKALAAGTLVILTSKLSQLLLDKGIIDESDVNSVGELVSSSIAILCEASNVSGDDVIKACDALIGMIDNIVPK